MTDSDHLGDVIDQSPRTILANAQKLLGAGAEIEDKSMFIPSLQGIHQIDPDQLKNLYDAYQDLQSNVGVLNTKIGEIVRRQSEDFLQAYKYEMQIIQRDLRDVKKKYEDFMFKASRSDHVDNIDKTLSFFRDEAQRLRQMVDERDKEIKNQKAQINLLKDENKFLTEYIMSNVRENKLISFEGSKINPRPSTPQRTGSSKMNDNRLNQSSFQGDKSNIFNQTQIDMEQTVFDTGLGKLDEFLHRLNKYTFSNKIAVFGEVETFFKDIVTFYEHRLQDTKIKCQRIVTKVKSDPNNKMLEKGSLSDFFQNCVDKVRGLIIRRKVEQKFNSTSKKKQFGRDSTNFDPKVTDADFAASDKLKILELFIDNTIVLKLLKYLVFWSYEQREQQYDNNAVPPPQKIQPDPEIAQYADILNDSRANYLDISFNQPSPDVSKFGFPGMTQSFDIEKADRRPHSPSIKKSPQIRGISQGSKRKDSYDMQQQRVSHKFQQLFQTQGVEAYRPKDRLTLKQAKLSFQS